MSLKSPHGKWGQYADNRSDLQKIKPLVQKNKNKNEEKTKEEKALGAYNKQYKHRWHKCGKYSHKPGDCKCLDQK